MLSEEPLSPERLQELLGKIDPAVLQQVMPLTGGVVTMMFTDIVDSTKVKAEIGDRPYFGDVLKRHNELVRDCISHHNGRELKTIGDAFLVGFAVPADGVACASEIQHRLATSPIHAGPSILRVRIGLHTGTPIVYHDAVTSRVDLSGTDVDKAARVEGLARGGQVLVSEETKTLTKPTDIHHWGPYELKGLGRHRIYEVLWPWKTPERPSGRPWLEPVRFLTRFVGREAEIAQIMDAVAAHRLVTLRGMGGIGKTRIADEVTARVSQAFEDGVFFIELAKIQDSEAAVISELVAALKVNPAGLPDEAAALQETLRNRRALLVLDNFEAVMSATPFVGRLLRRCPGLHLLATSQALLGLDGEQQMEVIPLETPPAEGSLTTELLARLDSFQLFQERARRKKPDWGVKPAEGSLVGDILEQTDGIPLSIELAAAWVDRITLADLRDGLKRNRSEYLMRTGQGVDEKRHAGIQACIDWSFNLLSPQERALFPKLSVFVGGFFAVDVARVCLLEAGSVTGLLDSLRERSLLLWTESLDKMRYRVLPTVREYAAEKLGQQAGELRRRHAQRFLEVSDVASDQIQGKEQIAGIDRITADLDNIRAGIENAIEIPDHGMVVRYSQAFTTYLRLKALFAEELMRAQQGLSAAQVLEDLQLVGACQNNLGNAYGDLPTGDRGANLQRARACYEAAIRGHEAAGLAERAERVRRVLGALDEQ